MKNVLYQSIVGSFMYALICTRPNIAYAVVSLFLTNLGPKLDDSETYYEISTRYPKLLLNIHWKINEEELKQNLTPKLWLLTVSTGVVNLVSVMHYSIGKSSACQ